MHVARQTPLPHAKIMDKVLVYIKEDVLLIKSKSNERASRKIKTLMPDSMLMVCLAHSVSCQTKTMAYKTKEHKDSSGTWRAYISGNSLKSRRYIKSIHQLTNTKTTPGYIAKETHKTMGVGTHQLLFKL